MGTFIIIIYFFITFVVFYFAYHKKFKKIIIDDFEDFIDEGGILIVLFSLLWLITVPAYAIWKSLDILTKRK